MIMRPENSGYAIFLELYNTGTNSVSVFEMFFKFKPALWGQKGVVMSTNTNPNNNNPNNNNPNNTPPPDPNNPNPTPDPSDDVEGFSTGAVLKIVGMFVLILMMGISTMVLFAKVRKLENELGKANIAAVEAKTAATEASKVAGETKIAAAEAGKVAAEAKTAAAEAGKVAGEAKTVADKALAVACKNHPYAVECGGDGTPPETSKVAEEAKTVADKALAVACKSHPRTIECGGDGEPPPVIRRTARTTPSTAKPATLAAAPDPELQKRLERVEGQLQGLDKLQGESK
ncbi:hypothetical protein C0416_03130 [bacterium]|nr:hypothetical protein [bacterium]